ncbi:hypothetical protein R1flu_022951 [Riccia fluitans]|uniref:Uncharacterized protein n=1 Tax=Riccia fluitans TaxID=41844 RepID=A0ABD1XQM3_9MARC
MEEKDEEESLIESSTHQTYNDDLQDEDFEEFSDLSSEDITIFLGVPDDKVPNYDRLEDHASLNVIFKQTNALKKYTIVDEVDTTEASKLGVHCTSSDSNY